MSKKKVPKLIQKYIDYKAWMYALYELFSDKQEIEETVRDMEMVSSYYNSMINILQGKSNENTQTNISSVSSQEGREQPDTMENANTGLDREGKDN